MNSYGQNRPTQRPADSFWVTRAGLVLIGFLAFAGSLLADEHRAHVFTGTGSGVLIGLLAFCMIMHFFMHDELGVMATSRLATDRETGHEPGEEGLRSVLSRLMPGPKRSRDEFRRLASPQLHGAAFR